MTIAMAGTDAGVWMSSHLHFDGRCHGPLGDAVVLNVVQPLAAKWTAVNQIKRWFFIRYTEGGAHIRFRILSTTIDCADELRRDLESFMRTHANLAAHDDRGVRRGEESSGDEFTARVPRSSVIRHAWVEYQPETERYGGAAALALAEDLFHGSSVLAAAILPRVDRQPRDFRIGLALTATAVVARAFWVDRRTVAQAMERYAEWFANLSSCGARSHAEQLRRDFLVGFEKQASAIREHVGLLWDALDARTGVGPHWDQFAEHLFDAARQLNALCNERLVLVRGVSASYQNAARALVPSYIHMTCNRLGLNNIEEAYVGDLIRLALDQ